MGCEYIEKKKPSVDHIVPYRLLLQLREANPLVNPNEQVNLIALCTKHHMKKTGMESRLFEGNVVRFISEAKSIIPENLIWDALEWYGLAKRKPTNNP